MPHRATIFLAIETSNPSAATPGEPGGPGVALARVVGTSIEPLAVEMLDPEAPHDANLMPAIDRLVARAGLRPRDLGAIAVSVGPGGYTAVRVGVTTAKFIAEATGARCYAVPSALVVAARVQNAGEPFAVALGSKDESTFLTRFCGQQKRLDQGKLATAPDLTADLKLLISDRFLPASIREHAQALGIRLVPSRFDPIACIEASMEVQPVEPALLLPLYPREPEAVTKWRALKAKQPKP